MKKTLQRLGMVTVGLSLCLWSCKEQDGLVKPSEATASVAPKIKEKIDFSVVEGRLKFETYEDFQGAIANNVNQKEMTKWEMNSGFTSLHEAYQEFMKQDVDGVQKFVNTSGYDDVISVSQDKAGINNYRISIQYPTLSCLTNKDGIVQIGNKVIKITNEESRVTDVKYINELISNTASSNISVHKINRHLSPESNKSGKVLSDWEETYTYDYYPSGYADRRFVIRKFFDDISLGWNGSFDNPEYHFIFITGVGIEHQRHNWYGWGSCAIDGWEWGNGSVNLENIGVAGIQPFTPISWGNSGGIVNQNTESIFLGTAGFFSAYEPWGDHGVKVTVQTNDVKGYTFGEKYLGSPGFIRYYQ